MSGCYRHQQRSRFGERCIVDQQRGYDSAGIEPQMSRVALLASL
jgi:hypothetical protein